MGRSKRVRLVTMVLLAFCLGALFLCIMATIQKKAIGAPLVRIGYMVPFMFGGLAGGCIGFFFYKMREYNLLLKERINTLESILPICSHCKRIRKPDADPDTLDSWEYMETYISRKTSSEFSHGVCPECLDIYYVDILSEDTKNKTGSES